MKRTAISLVASCLLFGGCAAVGGARQAPVRRVIPDPRECHELAEGVDATILVTAPDGTATLQAVYLPAGGAYCGPGAGAP